MVESSSGIKDGNTTAAGAGAGEDEVELEEFKDSISIACSAKALM
jgi:hypothetical protein